MELNGKLQLLVYADNVNMLGEYLQTVWENIYVFMKANKDIGLEIDFECSTKAKYVKWTYIV